MAGKKTSVDLLDLRKIGTAILTFIISNPELISKLLDKPARYLKKIVKGEDVSKETKKVVKKTINDNKSAGLTSILTSLLGLSNGDKETSNIFGNITSALKGSKSSGFDVGSLIGGLFSSSKKSGKTSKKKTSSSSGLTSLIKNFFK